MDRIFPREIWREIKNYLDTPQAIIVTGMRRVGKTYLMRFIYDKVESENKIFMDLEDPLTRKLFEEENYETIKTNLEARGLNFSKESYVFLDEIQWLVSIPSVVKYLIDHYSVKFFLTGSASFYLKNLFSESLSGRKFLFELHPLSFSEFIHFKESRLKIPDLTQEISETIYKLFQPLWRQYLEFGSFPEVVLAKDVNQKKALLQDIFKSYFQKEIEQLSDFRKSEKIRDFIILLAETIGSLLNIERLARELGVSRLTCEEWLSFLRATYLIDLVPPFSKSQRVAIRKAKKAYFSDWALASNIAEISSGQKLENCAFHLLRLKGEVSYYRKKSGAEIDLILDKKISFEVKKKASQSDEVNLKRLTGELGFKTSYVLTEFYSPVKTARPIFAL